MSQRRILVAIDFTPITTHLIEEAVNIAAGMEARVYLIYVVPRERGGQWMDRFNELAVFGVSEETMMEQQRTKLAERAQEIIYQLAKDYSKNGVVIEGRTARGHVVEEVIKEAKILEADMLICAAHRHEGLGHMIMGSVAAKLAEKAPCSVLVVRKRGDVVKG